MTFTRLIRFIAGDGQEYLGEAGSWAANETLIGREVPILEGDIFSNLSLSGRLAKVKKLLCPLERTPVFMCIGVNYQQHAIESGSKIPPYPVVFMKPADCLAGSDEAIIVPEHSHATLDYEGEVCVIIGKDCKDVSEAESLDYVLGFTVGNDFSTRMFQMPDTSGGQFCYAKSFDKFAPIGPCIASVQAVPDHKDLQLSTRVNGETRQQTSTNDLIWSVQKLIAHLSAGITLRKGTVIMTGTPSGVALFMKGKDAYLKDGDNVDVEISAIGTLSNTVRW